MSLDKAMKNLKFDKRLVDWGLRHGQLTQEELKKHLESLPDLKDKVDVLNLGDDRQKPEPH